MTASNTRLSAKTKAVLLAIVFSVASMAAFGFREMRLAADYSAHAALTAEIWMRLAEVPAGERYPDLLEQLRLKYPDGGDASLLQRFTYHSTGTNCTVATTLGGRELSKSYP